MKMNNERILNDFGICHTQCHRLYNPINIDYILEKKDQAAIEDNELLADSFILQVARLDERSKNHLQLVNIFAKLKQLGIKEKLYIVGDGSSREILQQHINEKGLEKECLLLGSRDNPYPCMQRAKLFVNTSQSEGLPTTLIESMVCGTPVVAMNCPTGPREIWQTENTGNLFRFMMKIGLLKKPLNYLIMKRNGNTILLYYRKRYSVLALKRLDRNF